MPTVFSNLVLKNEGLFLQSFTYFLSMAGGSTNPFISIFEMAKFLLTLEWPFKGKDKTV